ncbi:hypothetical protein D3Z36_02730 [Lachnospiraceae bacterium]|nr:hypothetical protein [Lachnospiraceae bacterium]
MKKPQLVKRLLAGSLVLALTVLDAVPASAAQMQQPENVMEAEDTEVSEDLQTEKPETESDVPETPEAEEAETKMPEAESETQGEEIQNLEMAEPQAGGQQELSDTSKEQVREAVTAIPSITQPAIEVIDNESSIRFRLSFTKTNCEGVRLEVKASDTGSVVESTSNYYSDNSIYSSDFYDSITQKSGIVPSVTYTFTLTPYTYTYDEDDNEQQVNGTPMSVIWTAPAIDTVTGLALKEMTPSGFFFSHSPVAKGAYVRYEYSANSAFDPNLAEVFSSYDYDDEDDNTVTIPYYNMEPGVVYYVRAYAVRYGMKGVFSNVVSVKAPVAEVTGISTEVFDKAITLNIGAGYGDYTGFQIARKTGKGKYQDLITTTDGSFKDTGLQKNTKYTYRVRAYYYNLNTKKSVYGDYSYKTVQTGVAAMNLKAQATGKDTVKLTWKKVSGADGYDVYRYVSSSSSSTFKSGESYDFSKYELVKKLGKKKKSYTDKKLVAGETYSYFVKAYELVKGEKVYFTEDSASASTKFSFNTSVNVYKEAQNPKNGTVSIAWKQIPQANGYLIEKYDETSNAWVTVKKITKAKTTSSTLPASPLGKSIEYRIRAFRGNKYSGSDKVTVRGCLAAVSGVKAKATENGIVISWNAVSGASYYKVYRTADSTTMYNADTKTYSYNNGSSVRIQAFKLASITENYYYTLGNSTVKMEKDYDTAKLLAYQRPGTNLTPDDDYYIDYTRIAGTSVTDYSYAYHEPVYNEQGIATKEDITLYGPQTDMSYQYYVVAYSELLDPVEQQYYTAYSYGGSKPASAAMAGTAAVKAPVITVKAAKKSVTVTYKKVAGAKKYLIYRSNSKKGPYELVTVTTKTKYKDSKLTSKKKYYYKVMAVAQNNLGADKCSSFSKVKSAKAK